MVLSIIIPYNLLVCSLLINTAIACKAVSHNENHKAGLTHYGIVDVTYNKYFPYREAYNNKVIPGCFKSGLSAENKDIQLVCKEHAFFLRPRSVISQWIKIQKQNGYLPITIKQFGIYNTHGKIIATDCNLPSTLYFSEKNSSTVTGIFISHSLNVKAYIFQKECTKEKSKINVTKDHLFYAKNRHNFIPAGKILPTDSLTSASGELIELSMKDTLKNDSQSEYILPQTVYNMELNRKNMYFVGAHKILVHNACLEDYFKHLKANGFVHSETDRHNQTWVSVKFDLSNAKHREKLPYYPLDEEKLLTAKSDKTLPGKIRARFKALGFNLLLPDSCGWKKTYRAALPMDLDAYMRLLPHFSDAVFISSESKMLTAMTGYNIIAQAQAQAQALAQALAQARIRELSINQAWEAQMKARVQQAHSEYNKYSCKELMQQFEEAHLAFKANQKYYD